MQSLGNGYCHQPRSKSRMRRSARVNIVGQKRIGLRAVRRDFASSTAYTRPVAEPRNAGRFPTLFPSLVGIVSVLMGGFLVVRTLVPPDGRSLSDVMPGGIGALVLGFIVLAGGAAIIRSP